MPKKFCSNCTPAESTVVFLSYSGLVSEHVDNMILSQTSKDFDDFGTPAFSVPWQGER